jgi:hypothetical protein
MGQHSMAIPGARLILAAILAFTGIRSLYRQHVLFYPLFVENIIANKRKIAIFNGIACTNKKHITRLQIAFLMRT